MEITQYAHNPLGSLKDVLKGGTLLEKGEPLI